MQRAREDRERVLRQAESAEVEACQRARDEARAEANEEHASETEALRRSAEEELTSRLAQQRDALLRERAAVMARAQEEAQRHLSDAQAGEQARRAAVEAEREKQQEQQRAALEAKQKELSEAWALKEGALRETIASERQDAQAQAESMRKAIEEAGSRAGRLRGERDALERTLRKVQEDADITRSQLEALGQALEEKTREHEAHTRDLEEDSRAAATAAVDRAREEGAVEEQARMQEELTRMEEQMTSALDAQAARLTREKEDALRHEREETEARWKQVAEEQMTSALDAQAARLTREKEDALRHEREETEARWKCEREKLERALREETRPDQQTADSRRSVASAATLENIKQKAAQKARKEAEAVFLSKEKRLRNEFEEASRRREQEARKAREAAEKRVAERVAKAKEKATQETRRQMQAQWTATKKQLRKDFEQEAHQKEFVIRQAAQKQLEGEVKRASERAAAETREQMKAQWDSTEKQLRKNFERMATAGEVAQSGAMLLSPRSASTRPLSPAQFRTAAIATAVCALVVSFFARWAFVRHRCSWECDVLSPHDTF